jgi:hypothetical protein
LLLADRREEYKELNTSLQFNAVYPDVLFDSQEIKIIHSDTSFNDVLE